MFVANFEVGSVRSSTPLRLSALGTSIVGHGLLAAALLLLLQTAPPAPQVLTRLVFIDAPPPPPPAAKAVVAEPVPPKPRPVEKKVARRPAAKPMAQPVEAPPPSAPAPPIEEAAPPPASAAGMEGGMAGGVAGGTGSAPVPAGQVARPPMLVHRVVPVYPSAARRRGVTGMVRLEAVLDVHGRVEDSVRVLQSIPDLDAAAAEALRQWRFAPARDQSGEPVRVVLEVPIQFVLR